MSAVMTFIQYQFHLQEHLQEYQNHEILKYKFNKIYERPVHL